MKIDFNENKCTIDYNENGNTDSKLIVNIELPELNGTEKQVKWAKDIRREKIERYADMIRGLLFKMGEEKFFAMDERVKSVQNFFDISLTTNENYSWIITEESAKWIIEEGRLKY